MNTIEVSACCKADLVEDFRENPRDHHDPIEIYSCSKCKKECEVEEVCAFCRGTGEVSEDEITPEGIARGVGIRKCICRDEKPDYSGATPGDR